MKATKIKVKKNSNCLKNLFFFFKKIYIIKNNAIKKVIIFIIKEPINKLIGRITTKIQMILEKIFFKEYILVI